VAAAIAAPGTALVAPSVQFAPRMVESPFGEAGGMRCRRNNGHSMKQHYEIMSQKSINTVRQGKTKR
jgi:hypothetical protein